MHACMHAHAEVKHTQSQQAANLEQGLDQAQLLVARAHDHGKVGADAPHAQLQVLRLPLVPGILPTMRDR